MVPKASLSPKMNIWLTHIPTESEVKNALDAISEDKAPGSDRFTMRIFKVLWDFIKFNLVAGLTHLFLGRSMVREVNRTFITLISKMKGVEQMEEFRSISCVGAIYKLHAKLLTGRLSIVSLFLISPAQAVFVEGRQLSNHYKLAWEMVNGFGRKATPRCFCLSIDLRKAFDTVD